MEFGLVLMLVAGPRRTRTEVTRKTRTTRPSA